MAYPTNKEPMGMGAFMILGDLGLEYRGMAEGEQIVGNGIIAALTAPLMEEEKVPAPFKDWSTETFTGTLEQINDWMHTHGWTNGTPVVSPTEEAVKEMLRGTELAGD